MWDSGLVDSFCRVLTRVFEPGMTDLQGCCRILVGVVLVSDV